MKKYFVLFIMLLASHSTQTSQPIDYRKKTANEMFQIMMGAHIRAFAVDNLFARPLDPDGLNTWNGTINHLNNYIELNSKNMFGIKDKKIINALTLLDQINFELIKNIKMAYKAKNNPEVLMSYVNMFQRLQNEVQYVQNLISLMEFDNVKKQSAQEILSALALTLDSTLQAAIKHIQQYLLI